MELFIWNTNNRFKIFCLWPWGRPDMALYKFVSNICNDKTIELFNNGDHVRDFTYIDDIVNGITSAIKFNVRIILIKI